MSDYKKNMERLTKCLERLHEEFCGGYAEDRIIELEFALHEHDKDVRADERAKTIEEFRTYLKTVIPCEMPQEIWNIGVDNTCNRMLKGEKE